MNEPPVMPAVDEAGGRAHAPGLVRFAYWAWLVSGALGLAGSVFLVFNQAVVVDAWSRATGRVRSEVVEIVAGYAIWLTVGSVVFLAFYWLMAHKAREGYRRSRILLAVVGMIGALFQFFFGGILVFGQLSSILTVLCVPLLYLPSARRFFDEHGR